MNKASLFTLALTLCCSISCVAARAEQLTVSNAWVREAPPTSQVLAAYLHIDNPGAKDVTIVGANSPQFETVELHRTELVDGVARMIPQPQLMVPAGGTVIFEPGGLHLMLIQSLKPLQRGDQVEIQFQLDSGGTLKLEAEVMPGMDGTMDHSHHHH